MLILRMRRTLRFGQAARVKARCGVLGMVVGSEPTSWTAGANGGINAAGLDYVAKLVPTRLANSLLALRRFDEVRQKYRTVPSVDAAVSGSSIASPISGLHDPAIRVFSRRATNFGTKTV